MFNMVIHSMSGPSSIDGNSRVNILKQMRAIEYHDEWAGHKETAEQKNTQQ